MNVDIAKLEAALEDLKGVLKDGLVTASIWDRQTGLALAGLNNPPPAADALFTQVTNDLGTALTSAGFPALNRYFLMDMAGDMSALVVLHGDDLLQGVLLNNKKANLGLLLAVALPRTLDLVSKARA